MPVTYNTFTEYDFFCFPPVRLREYRKNVFTSESSKKNSIYLFIFLLCTIHATWAHFTLKAHKAAYTNRTGSF